MNSLLICVLLSLVTTGLCLQCIECTNTSSFCSGPVVNCTAGKVCVSALTQMTPAAGDQTQTFERSCGYADHCNAYGSMSSFITTETLSTCCNANSCTPPTPTLNYSKKVQNGIQCPACLAHDIDQCPTQAVKNCTNSEEYCVEYEVTSDQGKTVIMGCASKNFCATAHSQKLVDGKVTAVSAVCFRASSGALRYQIYNLLPFLLLCQMIAVLPSV
ncbi:phospholipase A2 inhibitor and Ly6/PLAUR domain-containing protein-like [Pseudophryne corroboree]|uniref:phospholipase A2 inhibitor and Ly6/PLAUR domain-containing protein-like n=1 Tax=Pseudophryne corroboree TaxID=495146 RepID=UPI003081A517